MGQILEYKHWRIRATAKRLEGDKWSAEVECWDLGRGPRNQTSMGLPFTEQFDNPEDAEAAGEKHAISWADRQP